MLVKYLRALMNRFVSKNDLTSDADVKGKIARIASYGQKAPITIFTGKVANGWTVFQTFTCPSDGVVVIKGTSNIVGGYVCFDSGELGSITSSTTASRFTSRCSFRFYKGAKVRLCGDDVTEASAYFYPSNDTI